MPLQKQNARLISADWGTTSLRLRCLRLEPFAIEEEISLGCGVAETHTAWQESGNERDVFYLSRLGDALKGFTQSLEGLPLYLSGMASSSVGMRELPYGEVPFGFGDPLPSITLPASDACPHRVTLFSGLRWGTRDVMRGEEAQVMGLAANQSLSLPESFVLILPGTHSKHVRVERRSIVGFQTFLTGDLFEAVARHTILRHSLAPGLEVRDWAAFRGGVEQAAEESLLPSLFGIRCASLFGERSAPANSAYLSGLLIGSELAAVSRAAEPLLVAEDALGELYLEALGVLGQGRRVVRLPRQAMREAVPRAHAHALIHQSS